MGSTGKETGDGVMLHPPSRFPETSIDEVVSFLRSKAKPRKSKRKTLAEMDAAIAREVNKRHDRGRY